MTTPRIEALLSARLFLVPQVVSDRIYFLSNLSGKLSLYVMDHGGSVPEPLLPPNIALQNPHLIDGVSFQVYDRLGQILVMLDDNGDENYQPMLISLDGGVPEPAFGDQMDDYRVHASYPDLEEGLIYLAAESRKEPLIVAFQGNLKTGELIRQGASPYGAFISGVNDANDKAILIDGYSPGDNVLYLWEAGARDRRLLYGTPMEDREAGQDVLLNGITSCSFVDGDKALLFATTLFEDTGGLGTFDLDNPAEVQPVTISGVQHSGRGEMDGFDHLAGDRYRLAYNIDGVSWVYEATYDHAAKEMKLGRALVGQGELANGVLESIEWDEDGDRYALSFSTATSPSQIYTLEGPDRRIVKHTRERILGIPDDYLAPGEDASYTSFDGLDISARLYLPADALDFASPYPLVYYVHGGPQGQERPDFTWFSMPLIQFLTLNGFAVFVPNVRGSTGYGMQYMKHVDRDWGGKDRLDHVHAMTEVLPKDKRLDTERAAVVGRSYGGYMTLTLASRHPDLWKASCDMFGPYDLITFGERIPETWKPYFKIVLGDADIPKEREDLIARSPKTYFQDIGAPMLVIQGKNDPRVVEQESHDIVERLRAEGKHVDYLMFEDEGHDVLKFENRVRCYNAITDFFKEHLMG